MLHSGIKILKWFWFFFYILTFLHKLYKNLLITIHPFMKWRDLFIVLLNPTPLIPVICKSQKDLNSISCGLNGNVKTRGSQWSLLENRLGHQYHICYWLYATSILIGYWQPLIRPKVIYFAGYYFPIIGTQLLFTRIHSQEQQNYNFMQHFCTFGSYKAGVFNNSKQISVLQSP